MKLRFVLLAALAASFAQSAVAADIPARVYKAAPAVVPIDTWTGFYIGANGGYGWGRDRRDDLTAGGGFFTFGPGGILAGRQTTHPDGWVYGGQIGYNYQTSAWVFGLEGTLQGADLRDTQTSLFFPATDRFHSKVDLIATGTGRVGYAFGPWMPYIKGGYAGARLKARLFDITPAANFVESTAWNHGWTVGAGLEWMWTRNWIVGVEYSYMDFGSRTWTGTTMPVTVAENFRDSLAVSTVTGRISYKF
jgi:outer membrane immunogenic protein